MEHEWKLSYFDAAIEMMIDVSTSNKIIVERNTVPCGNALSVAKMVT